jgi:hypothetical protein
MLNLISQTWGNSIVSRIESEHHGTELST